MTSQHPHILNAQTAVVVVVDMQEPFFQPIFEKERVLDNVRLLMEGANILDVPILLTTQYASRMGGVLPQIEALLPAPQPPLDKLCFSCYADPGFADEIARLDRHQALLCGIETHICVSQTAHGLLAAGYQPHVVVDAVSSRTEANWRLGLEKMRQSGVILASVESALYEMMHEAGTPQFRQMLELVKRAAAHDKQVHS
ncbi:MAG TPA: isochorismatase family protein [Chthonomonadaceae bacterium]|nr:isochorismatase family protein [Chthonomonadaceae bacterium]